MKYAFHSNARTCFEVTVPYVTTKTNKKREEGGGVGRKSQMPENDGVACEFPQICENFPKANSWLSFKCP